MRPMDNQKTKSFSFLNNFFALLKREIGLHNLRDIEMDEDSQKQSIFLLLSIGSYIKVIRKGMIVFGILEKTLNESMFATHSSNLAAKY